MYTYCLGVAGDYYLSLMQVTDCENRRTVAYGVKYLVAFHVSARHLTNRICRFSNMYYSKYSTE